MARILKFSKACALCSVIWVFFALAGCVQSSLWQYQEMVSCSPEYKSAKLTLAPSNPFSGVGIELIKSADTTRGFVNVHAGQMASDEGVLWINNQPICFKGTLMEGRQRLLLPLAITRDIIQALAEGHSVTASINGYSTVLNDQTAQTTLKFKELSNNFTR